MIKITQRPEMYFKVMSTEAGAVAQWFVPTAFPRDPVSLSSTHIGWLTLQLKCQGTQYTFLNSTDSYIYMHTYPHKDIHIYM